MTELARLIRRRRLELRLTQREAAERAGLSLATWQNLERPGPSGNGFQDITLARAAHSLRLGLPPVFGAADRPLPDHDTSGWEDPPPAAPDADPDELIAYLAALLRDLAARSMTSFTVVYGQAIEAAQHLLDLHEQDAPPR